MLHRALKPLDFKADLAANTYANIMAAHRSSGLLNPTITLDRKLIVANNGETFLDTDVLNASLPADETLTFLCKPFTTSDQEPIQRLTVADIRAKAKTGIQFHFIYNQDLAKALQKLNPTMDDPAVIPLCPKTGLKLLFPLISPSGNSYSILMLSQIKEIQTKETYTELLYEPNSATGMDAVSYSTHGCVLVNKALRHLASTICNNYCALQGNQLTDVHDHYQMIQAERHNLLARLHREVGNTSAEGEITQVNQRLAYWNRVVRNSRVMQHHSRAPVRQLAETTGLPTIVAALAIGGILGKLLTTALKSENNAAYISGLVGCYLFYAWMFSMLIADTANTIATCRISGLENQLEAAYERITPQAYICLKQVLLELTKAENEFQQQLATAVQQTPPQI